MQKLSPQTKSFIVLMTIAVVGTYVCLALAIQVRNRNSQDANYGDYTTTIYSPNTSVIKDAQAAQDEPVIDTTSWKTYTNKQFGFSLKYDPDWKVLAATKTGDYNLIEIDPGKKFYNFKIYVNDKGFYAMDSVPVKEETISGKATQNASNMLYGIKNGSNYFTFDIGYSVNLRPEFNALVHSVSFMQ